LKNPEEESLKEKLKKLEMIEDVYVITTFFITICLLFLGIYSINDILEIIHSGERFNLDILRVVFIYLMILTEIMGFLIIRNYNRKQSKKS
jgi:hypothetical protein